MNFEGGVWWTPNFSPDPVKPAPARLYSCLLYKDLEAGESAGRDATSRISGVVVAASSSVAQTPTRPSKRAPAPPLRVLGVSPLGTVFASRATLPRQNPFVNTDDHAHTFTLSIASSALVTSSRPNNHHPLAAGYDLISAASIAADLPLEHLPPITLPPSIPETTRGPHEPYDTPIHPDLLCMISQQQ